jgi:ribosomal protein L32
MARQTRKQQQAAAEALAAQQTAEALTRRATYDAYKAVHPHNACPHGTILAPGVTCPNCATYAGERHLELYQGEW